MPKGGARNKKPTQLKILQGTNRADRAKRNEPKPAPLMPAQPPGLDEFGLEAWRRLAPILCRLGLLTEADGEAFWALCQTWSQLRKALLELNGMNPRDDDYRKVALTVEKARTDFRLMAIEFGLTPASRSRIDLPEIGDEGDGALEKLWTTR